MENDAGTESGNTQTTASSFTPKSNVKKVRILPYWHILCYKSYVIQFQMGVNLLKRSKHDLLRLLSILEGELEARDIYISTLEVCLNCNTSFSTVLWL